MPGLFATTPHCPQGQCPVTLWHWGERAGQLGLRTGRGPFQGRPGRIAAQVDFVASAAYCSIAHCKERRQAHRGWKLPVGPPGKIFFWISPGRQQGYKNTAVAEAARRNDQHEEPATLPALFTAVLRWALGSAPISAAARVTKLPLQMRRIARLCLCRLGLQFLGRRSSLASLRCC